MGSDIECDLNQCLNLYAPTIVVFVRKSSEISTDPSAKEMSVLSTVKAHMDVTTMVVVNSRQLASNHNHTPPLWGNIEGGTLMTRYVSRTECEIAPERCERGALRCDWSSTRMGSTGWMRSQRS